MRKGFMILERATFIAPSLKLRHVDTEIQAGRHTIIKGSKINVKMEEHTKKDP